MVLRKCIVLWLTIRLLPGKCRSAFCDQMFNFTSMNEIIFLVEEAAEGGYTAKALREAIFTEAGTLEELRSSIKEAVECHFDEGKAPRLIRLHIVRDELIAL